MRASSSSASDLPVVILCGGQGTRLREETEYRPKPMVEIGGNPILWHIMKIYGAQGFRRFVLCLGYKGFMIKQYFLRYHEHMRDFTICMRTGEPKFHNSNGEEDWEVTCAETGLDTHTGARLWNVQQYLDVDTFMLTYGDGVGDVDLAALLDFHHRQGRIATVTGVRPTSRYGEIEVDGHGRAVEFNEKPTIQEGVVSGGFFVFERGIFDYLSGEPKEHFEEQPLRRLARDGQLSVYLHEGAWHSMDTYRDYLFLNELWQSGHAPWRIWKD